MAESSAQTSSKTEVTQSFTINGKKYNSFDELPADVKQMLDKDGNGKIDLFEKFSGFSDKLAGQNIDPSTSEGREVLKEAFMSNIDPAKMASAGSFIRGLVIIGLLIGAAVYALQNFL